MSDNTIEDEKSLQLKVQHYESFINDVLRNRLKICMKLREDCCLDIQEYLQLRKTLENLKELDVNPLKTQVDLGCNFFIQAEVADVSKILVSVGFGFFLELTHPEAFEFIEKKVAILHDRVNLLEEESIQIKTDIKMLLHTLGQLQGL